MTTHADRDRSEPYWPPAATREPRVRFPLDDGDTGASLLPVAPAGTLLRCPVCPAALADTRGGRLDHCDDGSHHYVPAEDAEATAERRRRYATALDLHSFGLASTYWQRFVLRVMAVADAEQADLRDDVATSGILLDRQSALLTGVANALRGRPPALTHWSHADLPQRAADLTAYAQHEADATTDALARAEAAEATVARVRSVCRTTDGEWLDGEAEIPVGEVLRMLYPDGVVP